MGNFFKSKNLISGIEDCSNNFARGYFSVGKDIIDKTKKRIRKLTEKCSNLQGFIFNHSNGGGTGTGLMALILEHLSINYKKKSRISNTIYPSLQNSKCVPHVYNTLLDIHNELDLTN